MVVNKLLLRMGLVALIVRFAYFLQHAASPFFARPLLDQHYYDLCARQLAGAGGDIIDGFRPLLYPLFLSVFYALDLDGGIILSIVAQHILGIGMVMMVAYTAMHAFGSTKAGIVSGLLFAFSAPPLYFEGELLITTLFSFLLLLLWLIVFKATEAISSRRAATLWLIAGIILGLAAQARPNALPLLLIFPLLSLFQFIQSKRQTGKMPSPTVPQASCLPRPAWHPLLAVLGLLLIQTTFGFVNATYSGKFSLMTQAGGINFYLGNSHKADGMIPRQSRHVAYTGEYRDPIQVMAEQEYREVTGTQGEASPKTISNYWKTKTVDEIKQNPVRWLGLMAKKTWLMIWSHEVPNNRSFSFAASQETPILQWLPVRWWLLMALLPWGLAAWIKKGKHEAVLWSLSFFVLFSGTVVLFFVNSRFRIPLWPGLAIIGGGGATYIWSSIKTRHIPAVPIICSIALLLASTINWFSIPPDPIENDLSMRANAYQDQGRYDEAVKDIQACLEIAPNNPRYHFVHGNIQQASGDDKAAISAYLKAIALDPNDPMFHNNLGISFENIGNPGHAVTAYQKALELRPNHRAAKSNLLLLSIQTDQLDRARTLIKQMTPADLQNTTLQCAAEILAYKETGDPEALRRAKVIHPALTDQLTAP